MSNKRISTQLFPPSPESIQTIAKLLSHGEIVALPTETVYGLAANATSPSSVLKIFSAKDRPTYDPLIVHVSERVLKAEKGPIHHLIDKKLLSSEILKWGCLKELDAAMKEFWPGPLTFVLPRGNMIPNEVTANQETVGIRCPDHPLFQAVLSNLDFPLAAPSANRFGRISPTQASHVTDELSGRIAGVLDGGACTVGVESTIIQVEANGTITLLRPGKVGIPELELHFKRSVSTKTTLGEQNQAQLAPGMLDEHYAPRKPLLLIPNPYQLSDMGQYPESESDAYIAMTKIPSFIRARKHSSLKVLSEQNSLEEMAQKIFATLRALDQDPKVKTIYCDLPADEKSGLALAIRDRLKRASRNKPA
jgi:L-threonylcarbamoyladenylate synthase